MFKRMALSIIVIITIFVICFIINIVGSTPLFQEDNKCIKLNNSLTFNKHLFHILVVVTPTIVHILYGLYSLVIEISVLEFISCQTPQHMKGIVFGMY